jgi:hypothetical protein
MRIGRAGVQKIGLDEDGNSELQTTPGCAQTTMLCDPLLGGTTWLSGGFWAPDGVDSRFVSPAIGVVWGMVVSAVLLTRSPATRAGW